MEEKVWPAHGRSLCDPETSLQYHLESMSTVPLSKQLSQISTMPHRVLVIEPLQTIREILSLHLAKAGYDVVMADDPVTGGRILLADTPDLVICDVNLPYMTGLELLAAIRADDAISNVPVVFLTAREDAETYQRARSLRVNGYLNKPVRHEDLLAVIKRALTGKADK